MMVMCTGSGKTVTFAHISKRVLDETGLDVLVFSHRAEIVFQAKQKMEAITGHKAMIEMGEDSINPQRDRPRIVISTVQSLSSHKRLQKFDPSRYALVILDECFPAGTNIDGVPIEKLKKGSVVTSYNHKTNRIEPNVIERLMVRETDSICEIRLQNGKVLACTENHPFFNGKKYVSASTLLCNDMVYGNKIHKTTFAGKTVYRGGRFFARLTRSQESGRKENGGLEGVRVASVTIHQRGSGKGFDRLCPNGRVYNIQVANNHNYFADRILVHNCHHGLSVTNRKVIDHFRSNPKLKFLGVTATPERSDKLAMGTIFDDVAINYGIQEAVNDGWLVRPKQLYVNVEGIDLTHVRTTAGDLNQGDLSKIMEEDRNARAVVDAINSAVGTKKTLIFAASVLQADKMCVLSNMFMPGSSRFICGTTPKDERKQILDDYRLGKITRIVNCSVLIEGYDSPSTEVIAVARPTKSKSCYIQMVGRGLRPAEETSHKLGMMDAAGRLSLIADSIKPDVTILDFCGNSGRHKLVTLVDVLGGLYPDAIRAKVVKKAKKSGKVIDVAQELEHEQAMAQARLEAARKREADRHAKLESVTKYTLTEVDPFSILGMTHYENTIQQEGITEKQRIFLEKQGIPCSKFTKREAGRMIGEVMRRRQNGLPTFKQEALLHKLGHATTPENWRGVLDSHFAARKNNGVA